MKSFIFRDFWELKRGNQKQFFFLNSWVWELSPSSDSKVAQKYFATSHFGEVSQPPHQLAFCLNTRSPSPLLSLPPISGLLHHILKRPLLPPHLVSLLTALLFLIYLALPAFVRLHFNLALTPREMIAFFLFKQIPFFLSPLNMATAFYPCGELLLWPLPRIDSVIFHFKHGTQYWMPAFGVAFFSRSKCSVSNSIAVLLFHWPLSDCYSSSRLSHIAELTEADPQSRARLMSLSMSGTVKVVALQSRSVHF